MKPEFIIGIGSQRTGTTLMHRILSEATPIFMHPVKELHYYDTIYNVRNPEILTEFSRSQLKLFGDREPKDKKERCFLRTNRMLAGKKVETIDYIDLYRPCIMGNTHLGEITPEYMILPEEGVRKMFDDLGPNTRIVLISRHPVDRFISSVKLLKSYGGRDFDKDRLEEEIIEIFQTMPGWVSHQERLNDYETALNLYRKYFDRILFLSYEKMVSDPSTLHSQLGDFLEMKVDRNRFEDIIGKKVNSIAETGSISETTREMLSKRFEKYLVYLEKCFGNIYRDSR